MNRKKNSELTRLDEQEPETIVEHRDAEVEELKVNKRPASALSKPRIP
jgi:hypothetical protein